MSRIDLRIVIIFFVLYSCSGDENPEEDHTQFVAMDDSLIVETTYVDVSIDSIMEPLLENDSIESLKEETREVQKKTIFTKLEYDKIVAYEYEQVGPKGFVEVVRKYAEHKKEIPIGIHLNYFSSQAKKKLPIGIKIRGNTVIRNIINLSNEEIRAFDKIVSSPTTYGGVVEDCFYPHFAVVCYKDGRPNLIVEVCLECNYLSMTPKVQILKDIYSELFIGYVNDSSNNRALYGQRELINNCSSFYDTTSNCYAFYEEALIRGFRETGKIESFIKSVGLSPNYENGHKLD